ncbi:hypothetical protein BU23DRAFT_220602 [Bimuria novae-zelandiae CBS 107.79]|uniref:Uncharacterized protein n=1 Tax=Bimuria novae-zelandiae CBS 107.79 TaxID=1447943 RepID=A0A6A5UZ19_9PLEO|nr:hypothetical protein BU23DRAFT_220602 [Bimuria novae-zelandiae CBS 107.79]
MGRSPSTLTRNAASRCRVIQAYKPPLSASLREIRAEYSNWALKWLSRNALFVFTDETYISAGGRPHNRTRITIEHGRPAERCGFYTDPIYFKLMFGVPCARTSTSSAHASYGKRKRPRKRTSTSSSLTWRTSPSVRRPHFRK